jgi:hypothetical protein
MIPVSNFASLLQPDSIPSECISVMTEVNEISTLGTTLLQFIPQSAHSKYKHLLDSALTAAWRNVLLLCSPSAGMGRQYFKMLHRATLMLLHCFTWSNPLGHQGTTSTARVYCVSGGGLPELKLHFLFEDLAARVKEQPLLYASTPDNG